MRLLVALFALFLLAAPARAQGPADEMRALLDSLPGTPLPLARAELAALGPYGVSSQRVEAQELEGGGAMRITVDTPGPEAWSGGVNMRLTGEVQPGDVVFFAFPARAVEADNEAQSGLVSTFSVQENGGSYRSVAATSALVPIGTWRLVHGWGRADRALGPQTGMVAIHLAGVKQVLDLGPPVVVNLGPDVDTDALPTPRLDYPGREADAAWREAAAARIEEHRKAELSILVVDERGSPVPGATVRVRMTEHAFGFGTFVGHDIEGMEGEDGDRLRAMVASGFNLATSPLYWQDWGWQDEAYRENYLTSLGWLRDRGLTVRGHPLVWPVEGFVPSKVTALEGDERAVREAVLAHVEEVVSAAAPFGPVAYDAVNEPHVGDYLPRIGGETLLHDVFRVAREADPDAALFVNDYGMLSGGGRNEANLGYYEAWIEDALAAGVPLGGIGFQGHFGAALTDPARLVEVLERFSRFGLPIHITEFDIDTTDEVAKADYLRDAMTAAFSVPAVEAFVLWQFWEGDHWRPSAALVSRDWTPKPAWEAWLALSRKAWWTDETVTTSEDGRARVRGFVGTYAVEASREDASAIATAMLTREGGDAVIALR